MLNSSLLIFVAFAVASAVLCWLVAGPEAVLDGAWSALGLMAAVGPLIALGLLIAGFAMVLLPRELLAGWLGAQSGLRGLGIATLIGAVLPGGPFTFFPLVAVLARSGADVGAVMALLVSWASIGVQRLFVWELPLMGFDFAMVRVLVSLPLPILAGLAARWLARRFAALRPFEG